MKILKIALFSFLLASQAEAANFTITSPNVANNKLMPKAQEFNGYDCNGSNIFPGLKWENAPANTKSYAITVYDPDAPTGHGWWHWSAFNIPASTSAIASA